MKKQKSLGQVAFETDHRNAPPDQAWTWEQVSPDVHAAYERIAATVVRAWKRRQPQMEKKNRSAKT